MNDLKDKIKAIIELETKLGHFSVLDTKESPVLIQQILSNYEEEGCIKRQDSDLPQEKKNGELIFVGAPTGAGKDYLVAKISSQNREKRYVELNMDIFRHYFPIFMDTIGEISDKTFAIKTNEFAYELYATIQEVILQEFPGTNIIITGTLRETDWIENVFKRFKSDEKTNYTIKLVGLAVPKNESAISVIYRYLAIINTQDEWLRNFPGSARYTTMEYHDETFEKFPENFEYFENIFREEPGRLIDSIDVYTRSKNIKDSADKSRLYSSEDRSDERKAIDVITELRNREYKISYDNFSIIAERILANKDYLKSQGTLKDVIRSLAVLLNYPDIVKRLDKIIISDDEPDLGKN